MKNLNVNEKEITENLEREITLTGKPSVDKPWLKYYDGIPREEIEHPDIPKMSIYQLAKELNKGNGKKVALDVRFAANHYTKGIEITYDEYFKRCENNAKSSRHIGIKKDEIVPILVPNVPEARTLIYSSSILGSTVWPVSPIFLPTAQLEKMIKDNHIKNLFIFKDFYDKYVETLKKSSLENIITLDGTESLPLPMKAIVKGKSALVEKKGSFLQAKDKRLIPFSEYQKFARFEEDVEPVYEDNHVCTILGTSGTTGVPKGVCLTDHQVNAAALNYVRANILEGDIMDALLPSIGYGVSLLHYQTLDGKRVYLIPEILTTNTAEALCAIKPDSFPGGPVHYVNIKGSEEYKNGQMPAHKNYISGGASLPRELEKSLNGVDEGYAENGVVNENIFVRQGYGLSENVATGTYSKRGTYKFGSIGIPMMYNTISIFKPGTDEELTYNQEGEICITGESVMQGYLNNPEETDLVIKVHSDGKRWIHTKDIGYMDEDGNLFFAERIKNIFMRTGHNVHPQKITEYLITLPMVRNATVIGFDHPEQQQVPVAFIELEPSALFSKTEEELRNEIQELCYAHLDEPSVPIEYVMVNQLPINAGGKVDAPRIKEQAGIDFTKSDQVVQKQLKFN